MPPVPQDYMLVPQEAYASRTSRFAPEPPLTIRQGDNFGIRLDDAFRQNYSQLPDAEAVAAGFMPGKRIALRVNWPGYEPWHYHFTVPASAQKGAIVTEVARQMQRFLDEMRGNTPAADAQDWNIANIQLADLVLLELRHVAQGSRQPVLCKRV
ncbi:hypothetical protein PsYK624_043570 [Phanerochaete sordida]|uniref:Uncharacterized protein n=1 Tax=Phanerochaete sordida TaxID=48140 RepID=A0A9P3G5K1_9APHY|nr:hypothetical protein PsYK624_043570 [Phanerochaete sordida]